VSLALPAGNWKLRSLGAFAPGGGQPIMVAGRIENRCLRFQAPEFQVYQVLEATAIQ